MQKLASVSIFAIAVVFKVGAEFGLVVHVEGMFVAELVFIVGEGALP